MANTKKAETEKQNIRKFDLADIIFTKDNEEEGRWIEPVIFGQRIGIMFLVLGANSDRISVINEEMNMKLAEYSKIEDPEDRSKKINELYASSASKRVIGLKNAPDADITIDGKPVEYSQNVVKHIFEKSPETAKFVVRYSNDSGNFTNKKDA